MWYFYQKCRNFCYICAGVKKNFTYMWFTSACRRVRYPYCNKKVVWFESARKLNFLWNQTFIMNSYIYRKRELFLFFIIKTNFFILFKIYLNNIFFIIIFFYKEKNIYGRIFSRRYHIVIYLGGILFNKITSCCFGQSVKLLLFCQNITQTKCYTWFLVDCYF